MTRTRDLASALFSRENSLKLRVITPAPAEAAVEIINASKLSRRNWLVRTFWSREYMLGAIFISCNISNAAFCQSFRVGLMIDKVRLAISLFILFMI